jgi:uncharacterized protein with NAD-binding domain and iron-sulfur cluster
MRLNNPTPTDRSASSDPGSSFPYIPDDVGLGVALQPFVLSDSKMAVFFLDCGSEQLNALLDTYINNPSNGQYAYRCLSANGKSFAVMIQAQMTVDVRNPDGQLYGNERYSELSFWIPCYDRNAWQRGEFRPALFLPWLFPDSFTAIATGREMYGFRKQLANFRYPTGSINPLCPDFVGSTTGFKEFGAGVMGKTYDFISLSGGSGSVAGKALETVEAGIEDVVSRFLGKKWFCGETGEELIDIANDFLADCPAIFLKQFPAIEGSQNAQVRSITAAPFKLLKFRTLFPWLDGLSPRKFDLRLEKLASHPIVQELGLTPSSTGPDADVVQVSGFWVDLDFQLETGTTMANIQPPKKKIAVLGGGIGALSTVYGITETPGWQDKYDITIYQMGWRLGGKGASGRNREIADRIEEHGLHIWCGYYENAFNMIQKCYAEVGRPANVPLATWDMAFKPQSTIVLEEYAGFVNKSWRHWPLTFRPNHEVPGYGAERDHHPRVFFAHLREGLELLHKAMKEHVSRHEESRTHLVRHLSKHREHFLGDLLGAVAGAVEKPVEAFVGHEIDQFFAWLQSKYEQLPQRHTEEAHATIERDSPVVDHWKNLIKEMLDMLQQMLAPFAEAIDALRRIVIMIELGLAVAKGIIEDGVLWEGYDAINQYDFVEWLVRHGCSEAAANSAAVRSFYDLVLAFPNGKMEVTPGGVGIGGNVSAGELLHAYILVVLCYKGAVMWKMQAGMGDTVMTPIYQVLKARGVRFEFFNKVSNLRLAPDGKSIGAIEIDVQATVKPGLVEYNPLYDVKGLPCWPSAPLYEQLVQGEQLKLQHINLESSWTPWQPVAKKTLTLGTDFDSVVLGISVAALPYITGDLMAANERWKLMLDKASTTQTQAMQLWMNINLEETGWPLPSPVLDAYAEPFNTWAAMDQTLDKESWPQNALPFSIAYFCDTMPDAHPIPPFSDHTFPAREEARVRAEAQKWLETYAGHLWPFATQEDSQALDWSTLVDLADGVGIARLEAQYFRANIDPTERYVCNAKNTNQYRLKAGESGFGNLYLAGDWVDNGSLNLGCVESTVISGLQAARALTGYPLEIRYENPFNT